MSEVGKKKKKEGGRERVKREARDDGSHNKRSYGSQMLSCVA